MGKKKTKEPEPPAKDEFDPLEIVSKNPGTVVIMLGSSEDTILQSSCQALYKYAEKCEENCQTLLNLDVLEPLLKLMKSEDQIIRRNATMCIGTLGTHSNVRKVLRSLDCVESLISLLSPEEESVCHEFASMALASLAGNFSTKIEIFEKNGLEPLIQLLNSTDCDTQKNAVEAISLLVQDYQSRSAIKELNGFQPLLNMLDSPYAIIQEFALDALINCSLEAENRAVLREIEGLQKIVDFIGVKEYDDLHVKAMQVLSNCMLDLESMEVIQSSGSLQKLLAFAAESSVPEVQQQAAKAIATAAKCADNRKILHEQECEKTLITLLTTENSGVQAAAAEALAIMSESLSSRDVIGKLDGIPSLINLLKSEDCSAKECSSLALANLTTSNNINASIVMEKSGAEPLVRLLTDTKPQVQANAAVCLTNLAHNETWRTEIQSFGITSSLAVALNSNNPMVQGKMALAVASFLCDADARSEFRQHGGLVPLVKLLSSNVSEVRRSVSWAMVICGNDMVTASELSGLGALDILQTISQSSTRRSGFSDAALECLLDCNLPAKYSIRGYLSPSNIIQHGFYDYGKVRSDAKFLTLEELSQVDVNTSRPVLVVSVDESVNRPAPASTLSPATSEKTPKTKKSARELKRFKSQMDKEAIKPSVDRLSPVQVDMPSLPWKLPRDADLMMYIEQIKEHTATLLCMEEQVVELARFVCHKMGGVCQRGCLQSFSYELHISDLKQDLNSNLIPIGRIKYGIFYHRALLFKVLADRLTIPCSLVRGDYNRAWNEVMLNINTESDSPQYYPPRNYIVDLIYEPGLLLDASSAEADNYKRI